MSECLPLHDATSTCDERDGAGVLPLIDRALHVAGHALEAGRGESLRLWICRRQGLGPIGSRCVAGEKDDAKNARATDQGTRSPRHLTSAQIRERRTENHLRVGLPPSTGSRWQIPNISRRKVSPARYGI